MEMTHASTSTPPKDTALKEHASSQDPVESGAFAELFGQISGNGSSEPFSKALTVSDTATPHLQDPASTAPGSGPQLLGQTVGMQVADMLARTQFATTSVTDDESIDTENLPVSLLEAHAGSNSGTRLDNTQQADALKTEGSEISASQASDTDFHELPYATTVGQCEASSVLPAQEDEQRDEKLAVPERVKFTNDFPDEDEEVAAEEAFVRRQENLAADSLARDQAEASFRAALWTAPFPGLDSPAPADGTLDPISGPAKSEQKGGWSDAMTATQGEIFNRNETALGRPTEPLARDHRDVPSLQPNRSDQNQTSNEHEEEQLGAHASSVPQQNPGALQHGSAVDGQRFANQLTDVLKPTDMPAPEANLRVQGGELGQALADSARDGFGFVQLKLQPEGLGELDVRMRVVRGQVRVNISGEAPQLADLVQQSLGSLQEALGRHDLQLAALGFSGEDFVADASTGGYGESSADGSSFSHRDEGAPTARQQTQQLQELVSPESPRPRFKQRVIDVVL